VILRADALAEDGHSESPALNDRERAARYKGEVTKVGCWRPLATAPRPSS